ncbi:lytic polysaccharide monooxygenase [Lepidopterella palustris CBS 459.81]|uniref:Lytic polysaccharide monooxygenase n=1 Tax=Lepidopterella palustris CBS 459.81 TaxID=1314670 RepID=A0A8E2EE21_9PEZI|nr:lytic polysaccharide monooxygenase [Lepidopterella palustris CBS 459.81]
MKFSPATVAIAAFGLFASVNAHMKLSSPVPYGAASLNNSPLDDTGSDFPCKQRTGVYDISTMNNIAVGVPQTLSFIGSAVHGGGSCQVSVTLDKEPTKNSQWKVIHSIIGGCPSNVTGNLDENAEGTGAAVFEYSLPKGMPNGQYTLAWTWFNKVGNREMYMNCAPITVTGGGNDNSVMEKLPDMFVANIPRETCQIPADVNFQFPNPGDSVETRESTAIGTSLSGDCAAMTKLGAGAGTLGSAAGGASATGGASSVAASVPAATSAVSIPAATSNPGGVFAPGASSAVALPTSFTTLVITATAAPVAASSAAAVSSVAIPVGGTGVETAPAPSSTCVPCTTDGAVVCMGETQFGICNFGCAMPQALAAGTTCSNGTIGKRRARRIPPHAHRRHAAQKI